MIELGSLSSAQQLVVWSARSWIRGYNHGESVLEQLEQAYELTGIRKTARDVDELFEVIANGTKCHLCFGAPHCPAVHAVEATLINCLGAFQGGDFVGAAKILEHILHTPSAVRASVPAHRWAIAMKGVGWPLDLIPMDRVLSQDNAAVEVTEPKSDPQRTRQRMRFKFDQLSPPTGATIH